VEIFIGNEIAPGFFGWAVPFSGMARIGLARNPGRPACITSKDFYIILSLLQDTRAHVRNMLWGHSHGAAAKDSSGQCYACGGCGRTGQAYIGGGIYMGAVCAKIAGEVAARASRKECAPGEYEKKWRAIIGRELELGMRIHKSLGKLSDENLNEFIAFVNKPEISELITEHGDMDHPSVLLQKNHEKQEINCNS